MVTLLREDNIAKAPFFSKPYGHYKFPVRGFTTLSELETSSTWKMPPNMTPEESAVEGTKLGTGAVLWTQLTASKP